MDKEFQPQLEITNYEASCDGVVRHRKLKKPVGVINNRGYLIFGGGKKKYLSHRIIYECFNGLIKDGFVIDHIDGCLQNNKLDNLQAITQSENIKSGNAGTSKTDARRAIKSTDIHKDRKEYFNRCMRLRSIFIFVEP